MSRVCRWWFLAVAALLVVACGGSESVDEFADPVSEGSVYWEPGEWAFNVELDPWPVAARTTTTLRAVATMDDYEQVFSGTVAYRLVPDGESTGEWLPMREVGRDQGDMVFEAPVELPEGEVGIHFKINRRTDGTRHELTDWSVNVR